jgi:hypothetical protein
VAATARCKNDGKEASPIIATPPLFKKYRLEMFIAFSLLTNRTKNIFGAERGANYLGRA